MWGNFTYRANQSVDRGWHDVECRVDILVILSHVQHHPLTQWRRDALSLDWDAVLVDRGGHATVQHYVVLFLAAKENVRCGQLVKRAIKVFSSLPSTSRLLSLCDSWTVVGGMNYSFFSEKSLEG